MNASRPLLRAALVAALATVAALSQAQTQIVSYYFNQAGDAATSQPGTINVAPNSTVTLSVYLKTTGIGPTTSSATLLSFTTTAGGTGFGATPVANGLTAGAVTFAPDFASSLTNSGGAAASNTVGGVRPYGMDTEAGLVSGTFPSADAAPLRVYNFVLNVGNLAPGTVRPLALEADPSAQTFTSFVTTQSAGVTSYRYPASRYTANLVVSGVPEPASMAALGLGALALLRRRRSVA